MTKRILSVFVAVMMVLALVPAAVSAKAALGEGAVRDEAIASVEINGFEVPEWCNEPFYNVTVPEGAHYSVDDAAWFMYSTAFFDEMHPGESFDDPSMSYYMGVLLEPEEGWFFTEDEGQLSDDTVVLINGSDQYVNSTYITQDGYLAVYTVSFSVEDPSGEPIALHEISVNGFEVPPMIGWNSEDHLDLSVPAGAPYQLDLPNACWWNDDDDCEFEGIFEAGVNYSCGVTVFVNGNYYFADDCEFYINGGSVPIDPEYTEIDEEDNTVAYLWTLPTEAIPQGELIPIHEIYVNGFEDPVAGELASDHSSLTVPE
ncbi:MAG: hypothetical protein J6P98_01615, partial [Clostridia bacterium]|nr:hypothetical protein [Clostridia bacterium]